ncbi:flagellar biosynthetic protein FlhF [Thioalkalivibrio sp. K90mix]|nr:flagellar biosynthesis protein FlhF [Thioalkalivibrio sp. K90mix]ADC71682.1 flagellar biosynthetic protein FlhF [Thioalkalivibrio sp. K90mix]
MNVRRYRARDMRDAMRQVREQQGEDAVILSSRRVDGWLEVVAALEDGDAGVPEREQQAAVNAVHTPREAHPSASRPSPGSAWPADPELAAMRQELRDLRSLLTRQHSDNEAAQWAARHPLAAECKSRLMDRGFSESLARSLAGSILDDSTVEQAWERLRARLSGAIATRHPDILDEGGVLALVGPTGVGKTTTLARIALRQIRRMGADSVTLVTLDTQRIGATRQLQAFAQMAGVSLRVLQNPRELRDMAARAEDGHLILADTAGQAPSVVGDESLFAGWPDRVRCESWLVVSATTQASALRRVLDAFRKTEPAALVLTKLDEAEQLGETLSVLLDQHLGLTFVSDGQRIAEDFHRVETGDLTRRALGEERNPARRSSRDERWTDASLAEFSNASRSAPSPRRTQDAGVLEMIHPVGKGRYATH